MRFQVHIVHTIRSLQMGALGAVHHIVNGTEQQTQAMLNEGVLNYFPALLQHTDQEINQRAALCVSAITTKCQTQVQAVLDAGLVPLILPLFRLEDDLTQIAAVKIINNIAEN